MEPFQPFTEPSSSSKLPLLKLAPGMPSPDVWEIVPDNGSPFATTVSGDDDDTPPFAESGSEHMSMVERNRHNTQQKSGDATISIPSTMKTHSLIHPDRHNNSTWHIVRAILVFLGMFCILLTLVFGGLYLAGGGKI